MKNKDFFTILIIMILVIGAFLSGAFVTKQAYTEANEFYKEELTECINQSLNSIVELNDISLNNQGVYNDRTIKKYS